MPGMKRAARRKKHLSSYITEVELPQPFFGGDTVGAAWGRTKEGEPLLIFALGCEREKIADYVGLLKDATLHVIDHGSYLALTAAKDGEPIGRLATSLGSHLAAVVNELRTRRATKLHLGVFGLDRDPLPPFARPVVIQEGVVEDFEPIVMGEGEYTCCSFNVHTGTAYMHRFGTEEEARAQRSRNEAEDRPFVGMQTN